MYIYESLAGKYNFISAPKTWLAGAHRETIAETLPNSKEIALLRGSGVSLHTKEKDTSEDSLKPEVEVCRNICEKNKEYKYSSNKININPCFVGGDK